MSYKTRKRIWPLAAVIGVVAMLVVLGAIALPMSTVQAQPAPPPPIAPLAPTVEATAASATSIMVSWTPALLFASANTGYDVQRKSGGGAWTDVLIATTAMSHTDTGLMPGTEYTYQVRANNAQGAGAWSVEMSATTASAAVDAPMGVSAVHGGGAGQVVVEWTTSADVDSYEVTYSEIGGTAMTDSMDATSPHIITGLMAQTVYEVCVIAVVGSDKSVPACDTATTSRYLLTFDLRQFGSPNRTDEQNIVIPETPGATVTLRATVWVPDPIASSDETDTVAVRFMSDPADVTVTTANLLAVSENSIDDGELTIRPRDGDKRSFQISFDCVQDPTVLTVSIYDDEVQLVERGTITISCGVPDPEPGLGRTDESDAFSVVSYGDWEYDDVTDGFILDVSNGNPHLVNAHPHIETGLLSRDEPVVHELYTLGVSDKEMLKNLYNGSPRRAKEDPDNLLTRQEKNAYVEEGQRTVEVLTGQPNVQLTVTSMKSGPVYIRFLDSDMKPFGTDVDEESMWRGADVVGLDSQGRLELNNQEMELSKALALAYDQYNIVTPGAIPGQRADNSYLSGKDGTYNQGAFRFMNPCPSVGHHFYVEVYEPTGKYLRTTEKIDCVRSPKPGPTGLEFTIDSQEPGEGVLRFEPARNSVSHTVLLIDASNRNIVEEVEDAVSPVMFNEEDNVKLNNGWDYHIVVIAEGVNDQYTADAVLDYGVSWLDEAAVPLSADPSADPTRMHPLCQVDNADITALLADCDADPVNTAPMAGDAIADQTVTAGQSVMVQSTITDADTDDTLSWDAASDMTMYATATVDDMGMVTITGVAAGMATITVTATDMDDAMAMQEIMVTVEAANTAPTAVGTIAAVTVTAGEMSDAMDVSGYFSDADMGDMLTYTASSDMEMYATAMVNGSMLTITGVAAGMATITVTATDMDGEMATQPIMVTVTSAMLTAPSGLMPSDSTTDPGTLLVKVDWTPGAGAVGHLVMLFTSDWQGTPLIEGTPTGNSHTFSVDAGSYIAVVVAYDADGNIQLAISGVTTVGGG